MFTAKNSYTPGLWYFLSGMLLLLSFYEMYRVSGICAIGANSNPPIQVFIFSVLLLVYTVVTGKIDPRYKKIRKSNFLFSVAVFSVITFMGFGAAISKELTEILCV
jgi:hypothetical protein